jgi:rubrerythrin
MTELPANLREGAALAARMETDGIAFYAEAAEKVSGPAGRLMFGSLVKDEENHLRILNEILREMFHAGLGDLLAGSPSSRVTSVFEEHRRELEDRFAAEPGDTEALEIAMGMEQEGLKLYRAMADKAADPDEKALYLRLAEEERQHFLMLQNAQTFLADTGNWFIFEEHALMDGG